VKRRQEKSVKKNMRVGNEAKIGINVKRAITSALQKGPPRGEKKV